MIIDQSQAMVIDSIPVPVVKLARERMYRSFRKDLTRLRPKGYSAVIRDGSLAISFM